MAYWLMKSEPDVFSWDDLVAKGQQGEEWNGVRNYLARNNMRAMVLGDRVFFYHSNIGLEIVGIAEVCALSHPDSTAGEDLRWDCVDIRAVAPLPRAVTRDELKTIPDLADMALLTHTRLSVQPVTAPQWDRVCRISGLDPASV